ncbi:MAG: wax ester/triacylglycerol synthase family O-acyltransferase [Proteobacteria bacterium]|nr:wax ester/triacylglycerol synthase family O-acyltransferase [Pseudomonadota bacterium]
MSPVDRAWLLMERRTNPMMVVALIVLRRRLTITALRRIVTERFLPYERFRYRPVNDYVSASWVRDEDWDLTALVHRVGLPAPAGQAELEELASELASAPLPPTRPMWSFHLVENYQRGSAVLIRIHHCYADGIALVRVMFSLTDQAASLGAVPPADADSGKRDESGGGWFDSIDALYQPFSGLIERGLHLMLHPTEAAAAARGTAEIATELGNLATLSADPATRLKGVLSASKRVAWVEPLPLLEVRTLAKVLGCTINDVLMSTLAGAIGRYLEDCGEESEGLTIRAAVPVNLRRPGASVTALGNQFGLAFVDLPIGVRHPIQRLYAMHDAMAKVRKSQQPLVSFGLLAALGCMPSPLEERAVEALSAKATAVVSNLPGPQQELSMASAPISQLLFWVPQSGSIGIGVSILSYADHVQFGVIADSNLVPRPGELAAHFAQEFERLMLITLLGAPPPTR